MKYYSDKTKKIYETTEELEEAELALEEKKTKELALKEERAARAKEVEDAYKKYIELKSKFIEDYKSYHMTLTEKDLPALNTFSSDIWNLFNNFWLF